MRRSLYPRNALCRASRGDIIASLTMLMARFVSVCFSTLRLGTEDQVRVIKGYHDQHEDQAARLKPEFLSASLARVDLVAAYGGSEILYDSNSRARKGFADEPSWIAARSCTSQALGSRGLAC